MTIDAFYYNGEIDTLLIRLAILSPYVDQFRILEADTTFSGIYKGYTLIRDMHLLDEWADKIKFIPITGEMDDEDMLKIAYVSPNVGQGEHYWVREFVQKESLKYGLKDLSDDDLVFISDVDEIWNPSILPFVQGDRVYKPRQKPYMYYLNQRTDEDWLGWTGTVVTRYKNIKDACINHLRTDGMTEYEVIENGGWHFNSLGGRAKKQEAFKHPVYESDTEWQRREVNMRKDESDLPDYILNNREKWKRLFLA